MKISSKALLIGITVLASSIALFQQWQYFTKWINNKLEYKHNLFVIINNKAPNTINLYTNCLSGNDLSFNSGISAIYVKEDENDVYIQDKLTDMQVRIIDENTFRNYLISHEPKDVFSINSERVAQIISRDSTAICGLYRTIILK